jgi:hypothetical protein
MKKLILFFAVLITIAGYGQKHIIKPTLFDTTVSGSRFICSWDEGYFILQPVDSLRDDSVFQHNYFSLNGSNIEIVVKKKRVLSAGDTMIRLEHIQIPWVKIYALMSAAYGSEDFRKQIKAAMRQKGVFNKKVSEE